LPKKTILLKTRALAKFMVYILGYRPDEFGLVPDSQGFVTVKELIQVLHEEEGWRYVHHSHINEVLLSPERALFEWEENRIRSVDRKWSFEPVHRASLETKTYYTAIRRKAHRHVMETGLTAATNKFLILSPEREMAMRIGKRKDPKPVLIEVMAQTAIKEGVEFLSLGSLLLSRKIGTQFFIGPPIEEYHPKYKKRSEEKPSGLHKALEAGTFALDMEKILPNVKKQRKGRKPKGWKEELRKMRRKA